jgi:hypothetical protein
LSRNFDARSAASEAQHQGRRPAAEYGDTGGMTWSRRFDAPIPLHSGDGIRTLKEAGEYIVGLSKAEQNKQHWQLAAQELMAAAERGGIVMMADIAMRQALAHGCPKAPPAPRKKRGESYRIIR